MRCVLAAFIVFGSVLALQPSGTFAENALDLEKIIENKTPAALPASHARSVYGLRARRMGEAFISAGALALNSANPPPYMQEPAAGHGSARKGV